MATEARMAPKPGGAAKVDAYLAALPPDQAAALQDLRETILAIVPNPEEAISYAIPGVKYKGKGLVWYAAFKAHCSFFPGAKVEDYRSELDGYTLHKGTVQFTPDHPLPADLVQRMVRHGMTDIDHRVEAKIAARAEANAEAEAAGTRKRRK
jgi:uncharacterized protein YdhG (YjbR/CyaY superfamily)